MMENLDDRAIAQVADFFSAFAVPMRLKILNALRGGERNVARRGRDHEEDGRSGDRGIGRMRR